ncbi:hypothetical protein H4R21_002529 [Coemansia helicoidea]|uniref:Uncharacterized protein n=1 Tax=Coemansia helicoidea TaxID=1286919 RepID=A0ACC1L739_9FUNG|nr:hypothetical protein H4R21_002529 [Coemansia helicoidea]
MRLLRHVPLRGLAVVLVTLIAGACLLSYYRAQPAAPAETDQRLKEQRLKDQARQRAVRAAMKHAWAGYRAHAFGKDELQPLSKSFNQRWGGWAITMVDALDTLYLMGMMDEYEDAKRHVTTIDFSKTPPGHLVPVFEMTIRALGGLLGAYELDNDPKLLQKAKQVGDTLAKAFNTPTGLPYPALDLSGANSNKAKAFVCIAEGGTIQLEFKKLAQLTGEQRFRDIADRAAEALEKGDRPIKGLYPTFIEVVSGAYNVWSGYSVGSEADSFYEYLLKQHILHNMHQPKFGERYVTSVEAVKERLLGRSASGLAFLGSLASPDASLIPEMQHLACFYPGLLALGAQAMDRPQDLTLAEELARTCYLSYKSMATGLGPERFSLAARKHRRAPPAANRPSVLEAEPPKGDISAADPRYILRPETLETLFVLYRVTGDTKYQDWGWEIFQSIEKYTRVDDGYAAYLDVTRTTAAGNLQDSMESFFLAETLKYLYLLFSPTNLLPLNEFVLNTEAHPFRIMPN